jgi:hypothetical protein
MPIPTTPDFAEEISEDLLEDAVEGLKRINPPKSPHTSDAGIALEDIGIQTRHTTQKIQIRAIEEPDQDETVIDLDQRVLQLDRAFDEEEENATTESLDRRDFETLQRQRRELEGLTEDINDDDTAG